MAEYLISDELLTSIRQACYRAGKTGKEVFTVRTPSVEVVRCKECARSVPDDPDIISLGVYCKKFREEFPIGFFCAWGERREDA